MSPSALDRSHCVSFSPHVSHFTGEGTGEGCRGTRQGHACGPQACQPSRCPAAAAPRPAALPAGWRPSIAEITATSGKTVGCIVNPQQGRAPNYTTYYLTPKGGQSWRRVGLQVSKGTSCRGRELGRRSGPAAEGTVLAGARGSEVPGVAPQPASSFGHRQLEHCLQTGVAT